MRAPRNSLLAQLVAVAWVRGWIDNARVRAIASCNGADAGARIHGAVKGDHLVELPGHTPKRWCLSPHRLDCITSMPNQLHLRVQAEQTTQRIERITRIQIAQRDALRLQQRDAWSAAAINRGEARRAHAKANREAAEAARAAARQQEQAARQAAREARHAAKVAARQSHINLPGTRGRLGQMGPMRPPAPLGVDLIAQPLPSVPAPVTLTPPRARWADMPVQDPRGLLVAVRLPLAV